MIKYGRCLNHICQDNGANGVELPRITGVLSTRCFGYCELERPGETCLPITGSGAVFIRGFCITGGNASPTFQEKKTVLNQMTQFVEILVIFTLHLAILFRRNDSLHPR